MKTLLIIIILFISNATYSQEVTHWKKIYLNGVELPISGIIIMSSDSVTLYHYPYGYLKWKISQSYMHRGNMVYNLICGKNNALLMVYAGSMYYSYKIDDKYALVKIINGRVHPLKE